MKKIIKTGFVFLFVVGLFSSCNKKDLLLEDTMWKTLSNGSGIWIVERYENFYIDPDGTTTSYYVDDSENEKFYFYTKSEFAFGTMINNDYLERIYYHPVSDSYSYNGSFLISRLGGGAENVRITLDAGTVWTIEKGGKKRQTWISSGSAGEKTVIHLRKCNSCKPDFLGNGAEEIEG